MKPILRIRNERLTKAFKEFFDSEKSSAMVLVGCTAVSLLLANIIGQAYPDFYLKTYLGVEGFLRLSVEHWINDALMVIFFLMIGLELERELYAGELSNVRNALLPIFGAIGGLALPALIHFGFNAGTPTQAGIGIPMATDIAFAIGVLALLGSRVPASLKVFLVALAVMDDLGAIIIIAIFYTAELSLVYLGLALGVFALLIAINRLGVMSLIPYLVGGLFMWFFMLKSGVHATIAGVLLAFAIPFTHKRDDEKSPSYRLEHLIHRPVAFIILPIFALANTGIVIGGDWAADLSTTNSLGIILGLVVGKPIGITLVAFIAVMVGICRLPLDLNWKHVLGAGFLGGIGFTMSIFITNLAFVGGSPDFVSATVNSSKMAILVASVTAGALGFIFLKLFGQPNVGDFDMDTMDYEVDENGEEQPA
ncbi:MAG: Na+/H+ antiporter NhaA [Acidobacteria bacterium]|nr:Na+/H+ antiporter NhaA [Acidobacteriota bacterium]